ncbi:MAG: phenylalanyl-tRNA synthetase beta chain [Planctomycetota bacterium]|jgi:phenylalanyl-tRNA synthetase beta chain
MFISYRWLQRHIDLDGITPEELANDLTLSTAEVEGIEPFAPHLADIVVGHVETRVPHPDSDHLSLCTVDIGADENLQIVCGAPNVDAGQKVAIAKVGTRLPGVDKKLKKTKIRGIESRGMICSVRELALGDEHDGIWVLPREAEVGKSVDEALAMQDWVIEIDNKSITHRPDLWGHRGIAGEVAAIYSRELKPLDTSLPELGAGGGVRVRIDSPDCSRYMALAIDGAKPLPSPDWLRNLLLAVGQRPIDQLVDISNFVMLDLGQPNHTFDRDRLGTEGIVVRNAHAGESIQTLDEEERKLSTADLLICSGDTPVALAGVMGGEGSKVGLETTGLVLEVATFDPVVVRRTSARLGLRTDSSARFEKSLDPTLPAKAMAHYARTLSSFQPEVSFPSAISDEGAWTDPACVIRLRPERVREALGKDISDFEIRFILERLHFKVTDSKEGLQVHVPSARATKDIGIEQDLIEEVGRIYRYGNIPEQVMEAKVEPPPRHQRFTLVRKIQDRLAGSARFHELISYSFHDDKLLETLGLADKPHVEVINPVVEGQSRVRRTILPSLLAKLEQNRRQVGEVRIFEIGKGYRPEKRNARNEPREVHHLAAVWAGPPLPKKAAFDAGRMQQLRGVIDDLIEHLGLEAPEWRAVEGGLKWAHPVKRVGAYWPDQEEPAAMLAELEPGLARELGLSGELASDVAAVELSLGALLAAPQRPPGYRAIPRFPGVKVDVAVLMDGTRPSAEIVKAIEKAGKGLVVATELFDLYEGPNLGAGKKSLAYHVLLQSPTKTLSDKEAQKFLSRLERSLGELDAELRKG